MEFMSGKETQKSHALLGSLPSKPQNYERFTRSLTLFTVSAQVVYRLCVPSSALRETAFGRKDCL